MAISQRVTNAWTSQSKELHDIICKAKVPHAFKNISYLQHRVDAHLSRFLALLDDAPKNAEHRAAVKTGRVEIDGTTYRLNDNFIACTLFVSDELNMNEFNAVSLLLEAEKDPSIVNTDLVDASITLYHIERGYLLSTLDVILKLAKGASVSTDVKYVFQHLVRTLMDTPTTGKNGVEMTYAAKVIETIKGLKETIDKLKQDDMIVAPPPQPVNFGGQIGGAQPERKLSDEMFSFRITILTEESMYLYQILYHFGAQCWLDAKDVLAMIDQVQKADLVEVIAPYEITALLGILSSTRRDVVRGINFWGNDKVKAIHDNITNKMWKVSSVRSVFVLQWVTFLDRAVKHDNKMDSLLPATEDQRDELVNMAATAKAFSFLNDYLLYFQQTQSPNGFDWDQRRNYNDHSTDMDTDDQSSDPSDYTRFNVHILDDFQPCVIHEIETLSLSIISTFWGTLRTMKYREEDHTNLQVQVTQGQKRTLSREVRPCRDLEAFYILLASVYRGRPDAGYHFWPQDDNDQGLFTFLKWCMDLKVNATICACFDFMASIATGEQCATLTFHLLDVGTNRDHLESSTFFSWGKLFAALQYYTSLLQSNKSAWPASLSSEEEDMIKKYLYLLKQVLQYSGDARMALWTDPALKASQSIVEILNCPTSAELRVALYDVLAAFASQWGVDAHKVGKRAAHSIWRILEGEQPL